MSAARACGLGAKSSATLPETDRSRVRYQTNWPRGSAQRKARGEEQVAAMECYRRAMIGEQTFEGRRDNLSQANKLSRTYALLLDVLNRHRGKGQQKVTVEHVHVHSGGQAVVGVVETPGGGDRPKSEDQPHAKQLAHAPEPAMWSTDKERETVPIASNAERPLPDARRAIDGRSEG